MEGATTSKPKKKSRSKSRGDDDTMATAMKQMASEMMKMREELAAVTAENRLLRERLEAFESGRAPSPLSPESPTPTGNEDTDLMDFEEVKTRRTKKRSNPGKKENVNPKTEAPTPKAPRKEGPPTKENDEVTPREPERDPKLPPKIVLREKEK